MPWILAIGWIVFACIAAGAVALVVTSIRERRMRPVVVSVLVFGPVLTASAIALAADYPERVALVAAAVLAVLVVALALILPYGNRPSLRRVGTPDRVDERDTAFARFYRLEPGSEEFAQYYDDHPERRATDDAIRAMPNLTDPDALTFDPLTSPYQDTIFAVLGEITAGIEDDSAVSAEDRVNAPPAEYTRRVKGLARYLGAVAVGVTKLDAAHVYSHIGRSPGTWGDPINLAHSGAIAIAVEMDFGMVRHAPDSATTTESARQYFESAKIAMLVARYIHRLGYTARAHVDGNYRVMCVPVAVDAGLGELGRLGLLITPEYGPRVRLAVVTTDLPLAFDKRTDFGVQHFCSICRKCATNCPSGAISSGPKLSVGGVEKWRSDEDTCYRFWRTRGSDCAVCIRVCPYAHPGSFPHSLIRRLVRRNPLARRIALLGDDLFYGRKPRCAIKLPDWHDRHRR